MNITRARIPHPARKCASGEKCGIARGRGKVSILLACAAAICAAAPLSGCSDPDPQPSGSAEVLAAWDEVGTEATCAAITLRIACSGSLDAERFGVTARVDSDKRRYWVSLSEASVLPAGASTTRTLTVAYADSGERLVDGSAVVEGVWFE